jgi:gas vesicle protein
VTRPEEDSHEGLISLLTGLGVGILLGGAVALLLAPQSGDMTRARLRESADDALGRLRESMEDLRTKVEEVANTAKDAITHRKDAGPEALQGGAAGATDESAAPA